MAEYSQDKAYRVYVTRSLQLIPQDQYLQKSYSEVVQDINKPQDRRTGDEIAKDVILKAGLKFGDVNNEF